MPKTLDDVVAALKPLADGADLVSAVEALKNSEATAKTEATTHKTGLSTLHSTHNKVLSALKPLGFQDGEDATGFLAGLKTKLDQGVQNGQKLTNEQQRLQSIEQQLKTQSEKAERLARKSLKEALVSKLSPRLYGAEGHATLIVSEGMAVIGEDEKPIWKDGRPIEQGIEEFIANHKDDQRNTQGSGAGSGGPGGKRDENTMPRADFERLNPTAQMEFINKGGRPV